VRLESLFGKGKGREKGVSTTVSAKEGEEKARPQKPVPEK